MKVYPPLDPKEQMARAACLFLAEMLRTRQVSLERGADIAEQIVSRLDEIENETQFLEAVRELEFEFQELHHLEQDLALYHQVTSRERLEELVRGYVVESLPQAPEQALAIMDEALKPEITLEELRKRFPDFNIWITNQN